MPRQNRVTPYGELIAVPDRGMFWGNRGPLLDREGRLVRYSRGPAWVICVLSFKGRRRQQWTPGRLTELYFLDEATGLAAGHRPCGECRYREYQAFKHAWARDAGACRRRLAPRLVPRRSTRGCTQTGSPGQASGAGTGHRWPGSRPGPWWISAGRPGWCTTARCWPGHRAATGSARSGRLAIR